MRCSVNRFTLTLLLLMAAEVSFATPRLKDLTIHVLLHDNGDARITEVRQMTVEDTGTEYYIVMGNMDGSRVVDLEVSDETGACYDIVTTWRISDSRAAKAGRAAIVPKGDGYELCWGIGDSGNRTYNVSYTITQLIRAYDDADGFNHGFVADHLDPHAEHAKIIITKDGGFQNGEVRMWAFGFKGNINQYGTDVVAETEGELDSDHSMTVMLQFDKDLFHPTRQVAGSFETVKERAFEGSDYGKSFTDKLIEIGEWMLIWAVWLFVPLFYLWQLLKTWRFRRAIKKDLTWYRGLPYKGNLLRAHQVLCAMRYRSKNTKSLISACVMRLVSVGALRIEPLGDGSGNAALVIGPLQRVRGLADTKLLRKLHDIFTEAASDDGILQPKELKKWMGNYKNKDSLVAFMTEATSTREIKELRQELDECRKVLGLKKFLKDFTLANERHAVEVDLWKDYLVYAELFGIAKQLRRDMQKINPDYFRMDDAFNAMLNTKELPTMLNISLQGLLRALRYIQSDSSRSSGGGGSSSLGGGGGHTGGGSGGGIR